MFITLLKKASFALTVERLKCHYMTSIAVNTSHSQWANNFLECFEELGCHCSASPGIDGTRALLFKFLWGGGTQMLGFKYSVSQQYVDDARERRTTATLF
jgi:hypothetical protein